ncbi:MAG: hypothetical protein ACI9GM_000011 [Salibacteraceae bacterium]|jgi:hypothetical protein
MNILTNIPDHSRVWVYTANRAFTSDEVAQIEELGNTFVGAWKVHGAPLEAGFKMVYNQFLVMAVNENVAGASGCSIDSSVGFMKSIEKQFDVSILDKLNLAFHGNQNTIEVLPMFEFQDKIQNGDIHSETIVFNNLVETLGEFRNSWEVKLENSWHKQLL